MGKAPPTNESPTDATHFAICGLYELMIGLDLFGLVLLTRVTWTGYAGPGATATLQSYPLLLRVSVSSATLPTPSSTY